MKIAVITGSRADWSTQAPVARALAEAGHEVVVVALGDHRDRAGQAYWTTGWAGPTRRLYTLLPPFKTALEVPPHVAAAGGCAMVGGTVDDQDLVVVAADRFEMLGAALGAYLVGRPIAHIAGGDRTLGSADDQMRDAITMLSHLHFVTNLDALDRLINHLGVEGVRVFNTGSPALDTILKVKRKPLNDIVAPACISKINVLIAVHPATLDEPLADSSPTLSACLNFDAVHDDVTFFVSAPNADRGSERMRAELACFSTNVRKTVFIENLAHEDWLSLIAGCQLMVGNSSAGVYEAPAMGTPSIIVGTRQDGRPRVAAEYVGRDTALVFAAMEDWHWRRPACRQITFGTGSACDEIVKVIGKIEDPQALRRRRC